MSGRLHEVHRDDHHVPAVREESEEEHGAGIGAACIGAFMGALHCGISVLRVALLAWAVGALCIVLRRIVHRYIVYHVDAVVHCACRVALLQTGLA